MLSDKFEKYLIDKIEQGIPKIEIFGSDYVKSFNSLQYNEIIKYFYFFLVNIFLVCFFYVMTEQFHFIGFLVFGFLITVFFNMIDSSKSYPFVQDNEESIFYINKVYVLIQIHYMFYNEDRHIEIEEYLSIAYHDDKIVRDLETEERQFRLNRSMGLDSRTYNTDFNDITEKYIQDVSFFTKIFNRKEKSFEVFLNQMFKDSKNQDFLCIWLYCIPRTYSLDTTKELIKANRINLSNIGEVLIHLENVSKEKVNEGWDVVFTNYSETQIKRLFSVDFCPEEYIECLSILSKYRNGILKIDTMSGLVEFVKSNKLPLSQNIYELGQLEKLPNLKRIEELGIGQYKFKVISDVKELDFWGQSLKHCIKSYFNKCANGNSFLIGVYKDSFPYVNIEVKDNKVVQLRGKNNSCVEDEKLLKDFVEAFLSI